MPPLSDIALSVIALCALASSVAIGIHQLRRWKNRGKTCADFVSSFFHPLDTKQLVTISRTFPKHVRADLQLSLESSLKRIGSVSEFTGLRQEMSHMGIQFSGVISGGHYQVLMSAPQFEEVDVGTDTPVRCMNNGLWLVTQGATKLAVLMAPAEHYGQSQGIRVEVAYPQNQTATAISDQIFRAIEEGIAQAGSYRGKALSLEMTHDYSGQSNGIKVHKLRGVSRDEIILPDKVVDLLERNIMRFVEQRTKLASMGLSLKKGVLFFGPPGTGKTHTLHYLASALKGHSFLLITAEQQGLLTEYINLARLLQPSVVVIEDADLIARNRDASDGPCVESLLNKLLNEMDGLRPDAEILFILTTNRPESLEPALVARPGRVDQAIEFPLPDDKCRVRLLRMYVGNLKIDRSLEQSIVAKTEGVSAAFMKEFVRRAAQCSLEHGRTNEIVESDVENALQEMLHNSGVLNARLLGASTARTA